MKKLIFLLLLSATISISADAAGRRSYSGKAYFDGCRRFSFNFDKISGIVGWDRIRGGYRNYIDLRNVKSFFLAENAYCNTETRNLLGVKNKTPYFVCFVFDVDDELHRVCPSETVFYDMYEDVVAVLTRIAEDIDKPELKRHERLLRFYRAYPELSQIANRTDNENYFNAYMASKKAELDAIQTLLDSGKLRGTNRFAKNEITIGEFLGKGTYGEVYKCEIKNGRRETRECAVKFVKLEGLSDAGDLVGEIRLLMIMGDHPNIIKIYDAGYTRNHVWVVQEYMPQDLKKYSTDEYWDKDLYYIPLQILRGLNHMHKNGVFHLDIKPENILVRSNEAGSTLKLIDFGLSFSTIYFNLDTDELNAMPSPLTGSPAFNPIQALLFDSFADIIKRESYSAGLTIIESVLASYFDLPTREEPAMCDGRTDFGVDRSKMRDNKYCPRYWLTKIRDENFRSQDLAPANLVQLADVAAEMLKPHDQRMMVAAALKKIRYYERLNSLALGGSARQKRQGIRME